MREGWIGIHRYLEAIFQEGEMRMPGRERRGGLCGVKGGRGCSCGEIYQ